MSRLETLVQLGLKLEIGEKLTDTESATYFNQSLQEAHCEELMVDLLTMFYPTSPRPPNVDISTWYQQSADFQDITRILNGLLSKKEESDG